MHRRDPALAVVAVTSNRAAIEFVAPELWLSPEIARAFEESSIVYPSHPTSGLSYVGWIKQQVSRGKIVPPS